MKKIIIPILFILVSQVAGLIGSYFTSPAIPNWYASLNKPIFNPPSWIFGPAWILLYTLMGIAAYLVWKKWKKVQIAQLAVSLFFIHLVFNSLWSIFFFGLQNPELAFYLIIILWIMILALILIFKKVDKRAAWLMIPYLLWVSFATILNFSIWQLN